MFNERKQIRPIIVVGLLLSVAFPVFSMLSWIHAVCQKNKLHKWFRFTLTWPKICLFNCWCLNMNHKNVDSKRMLIRAIFISFT